MKKRNAYCVLRIAKEKMDFRQGTKEANSEDLRHASGGRIGIKYGVPGIPRINDPIIRQKINLIDPQRSWGLTEKEEKKYYCV